MKSFYREWVGEREVGLAVGADEEPKVGSYIYLNRKAAIYCVFIEVHRQPQFTC